MRKTIVQVVRYDDLDLAEKQVKNDATQTRTLGLAGRWVEVDLTEEHAAEFDALVDRYMKAGTTPETPPKPVRRRHPDDGDLAPLTRSRLRNEEIVAWAKANDHPVTERIAGGYYIPVRTKRAYDAHVAAQTEGVAP